MRCSYCGTELPEGSKFCNKCGEPVVIPERVEKQEKGIADAKFITQHAVMIIIMVGFVWLWVWLMTRNVLIGGLCAAGYVVIHVSAILLRSERRKSIDRQFYRDQTSICPYCGSHSIKTYRKGYDWNSAFWGTMFKLRGSRYTAGIESNLVMCRCQHCGMRWKTSYDYRLMDK